MFMDVIACLRFARICLLHTGIIIAYAQNRPINANADVSSTARGLNFGHSLHLHPYTHLHLYRVCVQRKPWRVCATAQTRLSLRCLAVRYLPKSNVLTQILLKMPPYLVLSVKLVMFLTLAFRPLILNAP